jgi:hypothetical protein
MRARRDGCSPGQPAVSDAGWANSRVSSGESHALTGSAGDRRCLRFTDGIAVVGFLRSRILSATDAARRTADN